MDDARPESLRERQKAQTRGLILDAMVAAMAAGELERATHDALAKTVGVSRQTVYRHFPDRESLMAGLWERQNARFTVNGMPKNEADLVSMLKPVFANFDRHPELIAIGQGTPQGRAMRMSVKARRAQIFRQATAEATQRLSERDAVLAAAVIQLLHGGAAWLEMRQQWDLSGEDSAEACAWAIRTLLADLHARGSRPLAED